MEKLVFGLVTVGLAIAVIAAITGVIDGAGGNANALKRENPYGSPSSAAELD